VAKLIEREGADYLLYKIFGEAATTGLMRLAERLEFDLGLKDDAVWNAMGKIKEELEESYEHYR
jgi:hypothetical protein